MPPVVGAVAAGALAALGPGIPIGGTLISGWAAGVLVGGANLLLSMATQALTPKPKAPEGPSFSQVDSGRSQLGRNQGMPKRLLLGTTMLSGDLVLFESSGSGNTHLNAVVPHVHHPCAGVLGWRINDEFVRADQADADGTVRSGRFAGKARLVTHLGGVNQDADADLIAALDGWTEADQGGGVTYTWGRFSYSQETWPQGFTGLAAVLRGTPLYDPRDEGVAILTSTATDPAVITTDGAHSLAVGDAVWIRDHDGAELVVRTPETRLLLAQQFEVRSVPAANQLTLYDMDGQVVALSAGGSGGTITAMRPSDNWALAVRWFLAHRWGYNAPDDELPDAYYIAAANVSDEQVPLTPEDRVFTVPTESQTAAATFDAAADTMATAQDMAAQTGNPVTLSAAGVAPGGTVAGEVYYALVVDSNTLRLAYSAARIEENPNLVVFTSAGAGTVRLNGTAVTVDAGAGTVAWTGHGLATGAAVTLTVDATLPGGLAAATPYYVIRLGARSFKLATSQANALAGTAIDITSAGAGAFTATDNAAVVRASTLVLADPATWKTGCAVTLSSDGTLPAGLAAATTYYVARLAADRFLLCATLEDARDFDGVAVTDAGVGTHTVTRVSQLRYTCNGSIDLDRAPDDILADLKTAGAGDVVYDQGEFRIFAGAFTASSASFGEDDLAGMPSGRAQAPFADRFNGVRCTFIDPDREFTWGDGPAYSNQTYIAEDGEPLWRDLPLPFTDDPVACQRLEKIGLEAGRQGATVAWPGKPWLFQTSVMDTVAASIDHLGYAGKLFRVIQATERPDGAIDFGLREIASSIWDWNLGEETAVDPAPDTSLPSLLDPVEPGAPVIAEAKYQTLDGAGVRARAVVTWQPSPDVFADHYQLQRKRPNEPDWTTQGEPETPRLAVDDIEPGVWDWRVRVINVRGVPSDWVEALGREFTGLGDQPAALTGLTIATAGGMAILRWDRHGALDVLVGGRIAFRHSPATSGASLSGSTTIGDPVPGGDTVAVLPLKPGTYIAQAVDVLGLRSEIATVTTDGATALAFANITSLAEHSGGFNGTHDDTVDDSGTLKLASQGAVDDWADVDAIASWDYASGIETAGTYTFQAGIDKGATGACRLRAAVTALISNTLDAIDSRVGQLDSWQDFDGTDGAPGDAQVWVRETDDDPAGTPTWGAWQRLDAGESDARAYQFQLRLSTADPSYQVAVSACTITVDEVA